MTDKEIVELITKGKEGKALQKLYKGFSTIQKSLKKMGASMEEAEDIYQEALFLLITKIQKREFELKSQLTTYLYSVCRFIYLNEQRSKRTISELPEDVLEMEDEYDWEMESKNRKAESALKQLGEKCRTLLVDFYHNNFNMEMIAKKFGFGSENSAKAQKFKCLEKAREHYYKLIG